MRHRAPKDEEVQPDREGGSYVTRSITFDLEIFEVMESHRGQSERLPISRSEEVRRALEHYYASIGYSLPPKQPEPKKKKGGRK